MTNGYMKITFPYKIDASTNGTELLRQGNFMNSASFKVIARYYR